MDMVSVLSWAATALSLSGNILIARKSRMGFVVWIASNFVWIAVNLLGAFNSAQVTMFAVYTATSIYGLVKWREDSANRTAAVETAL